VHGLGKTSGKRGNFGRAGLQAHFRNAAHVHQALFDRHGERETAAAHRGDDLERAAKTAI